MTEAIRRRLVASVLILESIGIAAAGLLLAWLPDDPERPESAALAAGITGLGSLTAALLLLVAIAVLRGWSRTQGWRRTAARGGIVGVLAVHGVSAVLVTTGAFTAEPGAQPVWQAELALVAGAWALVLLFAADAHATFGDERCEREG